MTEADLLARLNRLAQVGAWLTPEEIAIVLGWREKLKRPRNGRPRKYDYATEDEKWRVYNTNCPSRRKSRQKQPD